MADPDWLARVQANDPQLSELGVDQGDVRALAAALHHNTALTELTLSIRVDPHVLPLFAALPGLRVLRVLGAEYGPALIAFAAALRHNTALTSLAIISTPLLNAGAAALAETLHHNTTLSSLTLACQMGPTEGQALAAALVHNTTLTSIALWGNSLGDAGAAAFAAVLERNSTLQNLGVGDNNIGSNGARSLASALQRNSTLRWLDVSGNAWTGDIIALAVETHPSLTSLDLTNTWNYELGQTAAALLRRSTVLRTLKLQRNLFFRKDLAAMAAALEFNHALETIELVSCGVEDAGAHAFARVLEANTTLTRLDLSRNDFLADGAFALAAALARNTTLTSLGVPFRSYVGAAPHAFATTLSGGNFTLLALEGYDYEVFSSIDLTADGVGALLDRNRAVMAARRGRVGKLVFLHCLAEELCSAATRLCCCWG